MSENLLYSLDDVVIIPEKLTKITTRQQCSPYYYIHDKIPLGMQMLPIFVAPMSSVLNERNWNEFKSNSLNPVLPRSVKFENRLEWCKRVFTAFSLKEFRNFVSYYEKSADFASPYKDTYYVCIDVANGHMKAIYDACKYAKKVFGDSLVIMVGNIANPETYKEIAELECVDFVRVGIGTGGACTTSVNTAIHYPMASLISKCRKIKLQGGYKYPCIVADGGFNNFDQIIKALALGADFVMCGQIFAKSKDACGRVHKDFNILRWLRGGKLIKTYREYYGMSTRKAQKELGEDGNKTPEGITKLVEVEYTVFDWVGKFISYLQSAMSYTNCTKLQEFIGGPLIGLQTQAAYISYYK